MTYVQFALLGLGAGAVYVLLAQGVVLIYRASGIVNFAQGALAMFGSYAFFQMRQYVNNYAVAMLVAVALTGLIGLAMYTLVMRRLQHASPLARAISTLGLLAILEAIATLRYQATSQIIPISLPHNLIRMGSVVVPADQLWLLAIAAAITAVLAALSRFTLLGKATSAVSENELAAASLGWSPHFIGGVNWFVGSALAGVAGVLIAPLTGLSVEGLVLLVVPTFAAALLGRFDSFGLTLAGGLIVGILQSDVGELTSATGWPQAVPLLVVILVLVIRGRGLPLRGYVSDKLPELGTGRVSVIPLVVVAGGIAVLSATVLPVSWVADISVSAVFSIFILSVVVLTGYAGQLSLAQLALGGIGALIAARLVQHGVPFEFAILAALLGTAAVGVAFGLPALRTRGVNLAVVTLCLGAAVQAVVFDNVGYIGGDAGTPIPPTTFLGLNIDLITNPRSYTVFCLAALIVASLLVCNVRRGKTGRRLIAVRTNERSAASLGINVFEAKLFAFALSAGLAALAGILYAFSGPTVVYTGFDPLSSVNVVTLAVIGGIGYVLGAPLGSTLASGGVGLIIANAIVGSNASEWIALVGGIFMILIIIQDPNGLAPHNAALFRRLADRLPWQRVAERSTRLSQTQAQAQAPRGEQARVYPRSLRVTSLSVKFSGVVALDDVSLEVHPGQIVGLIGPNGAGKTTFIDAVTGFVKPASGLVMLGDRRIERLSPFRRTRAGLTRSFQALELFDDITVRENLRAASDRRDKLSYVSELFKPSNPPLTPTTLASIRDFGLEPYLDKRPEEISYGRRRLVAIARSVATEPSVLLLDEPAAGLSSAESAELAHLLRRLADNWRIAILIVEHDMSVVMKICDHVTVLDFGHVIASGPTEKVRFDPAVVSAYLGEPSGLAEPSGPGLVT